MHWLPPPPFFYMEAKFGSLEKGIKKDWHPSRLKFFRMTARYTLCDNKCSEEISLELKLEPVGKKQRGHQSNSLRHVTRIRKKKKNRMTNVMLNYTCRQNGCRRLGELWREIYSRQNPICEVYLVTDDDDDDDDKNKGMCCTGKMKNRAFGTLPCFLLGNKILRT